eukprot:2174290-Pyramimonas_sp.AAC.2
MGSQVCGYMFCVWAAPTCESWWSTSRHTHTHSMRSLKASKACWARYILKRSVGLISYGNTCKTSCIISPWKKSRSQGCGSLSAPNKALCSCLREPLRFYWVSNVPAESSLGYTVLGEFRTSHLHT